MNWSIAKPHTDETEAQALEPFARFAWLMDQSLQIPGTKIRLGLDGLIGFLPIGGDLATGLFQALFVVFAERRFGLPKSVVRRMAANVAIDVLVGAIPILGDLFDVHFKANVRNLALLKKHIAPTGHTIPHRHDTRGSGSAARRVKSKR